MSDPDTRRAAELARAALVPLGFWVDIAAKAQVPMIPCDFSSPFTPWYEDEDMPEDGHAVVEWYNARTFEAYKRDEPGVLRWECSAQSAIKSDCAHGRGWGSEWQDWDPFDLRAADGPPFGPLIVDANGQTRLVWRPYVQPQLVDGYPLEFRVFSNANGGRAVSSYYPQRPLPSGYATKARTASVAAALLEIAGRPWQCGFTADFLYDEGGTLWFLEGGPPHVNAGLISADPCCFKPGKVRLCDIALVNRNAPRGTP